MAYILGIESSCDETAAAVIKDNLELSSIIYSQEIHKQYGGVVPEMASRLHEQQISYVVEKAIQKANISLTALDAIAFTNGPGLVGALWVGNMFVKGLAMSLNKPIVAVNHLKAHIIAHFLTTNPPPFPFLCLTVSGGHTQIVVVHSHTDMEVVITTQDDAAGECFDKVGKNMGLEYPAGPIIDVLAQHGNASAFVYPRPRTKTGNYSFSGLKTAFLYHIQKETLTNPNFIHENKADLAASIQKAIVDYLLSIFIKKAKEFNIRHLAISGGVSANTYLRTQLALLSKKHAYTFYSLPLLYCTDNAAMIAITGYYQYLAGDIATLDVAPFAKYKV